MKKERVENNSFICEKCNGLYKIGESEYFFIKDKNNNGKIILVCQNCLLKYTESFICEQCGILIIRGGWENDPCPFYIKENEKEKLVCRVCHQKYYWSYLIQSR